MILPAHPQNPLLLIGYDLKSTLRRSRIITVASKAGSSARILAAAVKVGDSCRR